MTRNMWYGKKTKNAPKTQYKALSTGRSSSDLIFLPILRFPQMNTTVLSLKQAMRPAG